MYPVTPDASNIITVYMVHNQTRTTQILIITQINDINCLLIVLVQFSQIYDMKTLKSMTYYVHHCTCMILEVEIFIYHLIT